MQYPQGNLVNANSTTVTSQTNAVSLVSMASNRQMTSSNWQAMTAQPKLQKVLHAPPRNRKLPPTRATNHCSYRCMKQHLEWGLHGDNTDCQNLYTASLQSKHSQHRPSMKGTKSCMRSISKATNANMPPMSYHTAGTHLKGISKTVRTGSAAEATNRKNRQTIPKLQSLSHQNNCKGKRPISVSKSLQNVDGNRWQIDLS